MVETDVEDGAGGGDGSVNPDLSRSFSTLSLGPPGVLCCAAVCASAMAVPSVRKTVAATATVNFDVMCVSEKRLARADTMFDGQTADFARHVF